MALTKTDLPAPSWRSGSFGTDRENRAPVATIGTGNTDVSRQCFPDGLLHATAKQTRLAGIRRISITRPEIPWSSNNADEEARSNYSAPMLSSGGRPEI